MRNPLLQPSKGDVVESNGARYYVARSSTGMVGYYVRGANTNGKRSSYFVVHWGEWNSIVYNGNVISIEEQ